MRMPKKTSGDSQREIEIYRHEDKERLNNPPVGLVTTDTDPDTGQKKKKYEYDPHLDPQLTWAGKAEHTSFEVPTVSLHVHERIEARTIIEAVSKKPDPSGTKQLSLFATPKENPPLREAVEFYQHSHDWSNRLVAGDSLLVMNSLLEKEGMAGKVQMVYFDPPYGIKYGSNFQPFVNKRDVKDGKDDDLTSEPEQIRAFRDTWELGIHSYLTYLRDRLLLARELLTESGSIFVQISDENVHHVRELMDEVLGAKNFVSMISYKTTQSAGAKTLDSTCDYIVWYSKYKEKLKFHNLYKVLSRGERGATRYSFAENVITGEIKRAVSEIEFDDITSWRFFTDQGLTSRGIGSPISMGSVFFEGESYQPPAGHWRTSKINIEQRLIPAQRLLKTSGTIRYKKYFDDFGCLSLSNLWEDVGGGIQSRSDPKIYAVQTNNSVIERCLLMTTDPGDLVFDPTCGSGTTAYVAEQWGRRWITCDTSRVALTLAKQRLMTSVFDYYQLAHPEEGIGSGFNYKTVPHITLKSIANNPEIDGIYARMHPAMEQELAKINEGLGAGMAALQEWEVPFELPEDWPEQVHVPFAAFHKARMDMRQMMDEAIARHAPTETLYDQPLLDKKKKRVSGPFTVEAVPAPVVKSIEDTLTPTLSQGEREFPADASIARSGETLRQDEWRDELIKTGIRGKSGQYVRFARLEPLPGCSWLHADGETRPSAEGADAFGEDAPAYNPMRVVVSFGPDHAPLEQRQVERAWEEAKQLEPRPKLLVFAAFQFDPEAAKDIDQMKPELSGMQFLKVQMNADMLTDDLKMKRAGNDSFWLIGQPDVRPKKIDKGEHKGKWQVSVEGFDYYNTKTGSIESGGADKIAVWLLDTDYDGRSLFPSQVFFPQAGDKEGWARLARNLKAEIDADLIESYRGTTSLPFAPGKHRRIAVKIVDDRGIESLKVLEVG
jgi:adenine-specific DNA-methyltransferase